MKFPNKLLSDFVRRFSTMMYMTGIDKRLKTESKSADYLGNLLKLFTA